MFNKSSVIAFIITFLTATAVFAQDGANVKPSVVTGDVTSIAEGKLSVTAQSGPMDVILTEKTIFKRVPAENPNLRSAVDSSLSEIKVGDRLLVTGFPAADNKSIPANTIYLMSKDDIAKKDAKQAGEWTTRGVSGRVSKVDPATGQITVSVRGLNQTTDVVITPKADAKVLRYAPNSIKFSEASPSTIDKVLVGDMLRALGDRSADGTSFAAEEIISGSFVTVVGTVKNVDVEAKMLVVTDLSNNKDVTISLSSPSMMKKFPEEMAQRMAAAQNGGAPGQGGPGQGAPANGGQGTPPAEGQAGPGGRRGGRGSIDEMLERFPSIAIADIKVGDKIAISSTKQPEGTPLSAIKLLAGVEPFITAQTAARGNGGRRGQGGQNTGFTIPGLDGMDMQ